MSQVQLRIAVVDDQESVRKAISRLLRSVGMAVETFPDGDTFLEAMQFRPAVCVVPDLHMPRMSGFDVLDRLFGNQLPVLVLTGHDSTESEVRALAGGAAAYLLKPVDVSTLLKAIAAAVLSATNNRPGMFAGLPRSDLARTIISTSEQFPPDGLTSFCRV